MNRSYSNGLLTAVKHFLRVRTSAWVKAIVKTLTNRPHGAETGKIRSYGSLHTKHHNGFQGPQGPQQQKR